MNDQDLLSCGIKRHPPGPARELSLTEIRSRPLEFITGLLREYGDIVQYRALGWRATLVNRPDYVKQVLLSRAHNYTKEGTPDLMMLKPMLGNGLLTSDGEEWEAQRSLLQPMFQRQCVERFAGWITEAGMAMLDRWQRVPSDTSLEMTREMTTLTLRIVARALFGYEVLDEADSFGQAVEVLNESMGHLDAGAAGGTRAFGEALNVVRSTVLRVIVERLAGESMGDDTLGYLIRHSQKHGPDFLTSTELLDQVLTLLLAGHETTAKALCWALYLLSQHPEAALRVRCEADTVLAGGRAPTIEDLPRLSYSWAVIQEALRLYPPIWLMSRTARADDFIDGFIIPAGGLVLFSPFLLNRKPSLWAAPELFRPERFLNPEEHSGLSPFSYLPFGAGPRQCIGRQFASIELRLLLPMIWRRYHLDLVPGHAVEPEALVTLRPKYGLPMFVRTQSAEGPNDAPRLA
jgi:cytochrome P450